MDTSSLSIEWNESTLARIIIVIGSTIIIVFTYHKNYCVLIEKHVNHIILLKK